MLLILFPFLLAKARPFSSVQDNRIDNDAGEMEERNSSGGGPIPGEDHNCKANEDKAQATDGYAPEGPTPVSEVRSSAGEVRHKMQPGCIRTTI